MERGMMFAIQSYFRSGTHLLKSSLLKHPEIHCFGEIFNPDCEDCVDTTEEILNRMRASKKQIGFVEHASRGSKHRAFRKMDRGFALWDDIRIAKRSEKIIVINLFRKNLFERFVSQQVAKRTGQWGTSDPGYILRADPWEVVPKEVEKDFGIVLFVRNEAKQRFPNAPWFSYEGLVNRPHQVLRKIQERLGVVPASIGPGTIKQGLSMRKTITNYDKVKSYFANTKYAEFFTE